MRQILLTLALSMLLVPTVAAQTLGFGSSYTLFSTGENADYSGTIDLDATLPAGIEANYFFDHLKGDKSYTETSVSAHSPSGLFGVYEVQDTAQATAQHLVGVGYRASAGPFVIAGKYFPYSTEGATDFAAEVSASAIVGNWTFQGFVDVLRDDMLDDTRYFSKSQAIRPLMEMVDLVAEYRWTREFGQHDRAVWFGVTFGI